MKLIQYQIILTDKLILKGGGDQMKSEEDTEEKGYNLFIRNFPLNLRRDIRIIAAKKDQGYKTTILEILKKECNSQLNT